ncbi:hypothetical protein AMTRI_Chr13g122200 [Amborella trichopoda]
MAGERGEGGEVLPLPLSRSSSRGGVGGRGMRGRWVMFRKRRERWLVVLGVVLHAIYMLSIFDIYFKTPIVHGMDPVEPRINPPAKRLVLLLDASFLDVWSFDQFQSLVNGSKDDPVINQLLHQDKVVIFLHLLGCDTNGHAHKPYSSIYLNNIKVVDDIAESTYKLVEDLFKDNATAYIFTADHGMSDKGSHGDGHPSNTETPLVAWGAGIRGPRTSYIKHRSSNNFRFVDEHTHDMPTPIEWGLRDVERVDVNQADIAPLMSTLLGLPCPMNSVGNLPLEFVDMNEEDEAEAALANAKQVLHQFRRKSQIKQSHSLSFKPFKPLENSTSVVNEIEDLISQKDYEAAVRLSQSLRTLSLAGLHYFQTYDWMMLMTTITLGYVGWMVYIVMHVLKWYTYLQEKYSLTKNLAILMDQRDTKVYIFGTLLMGIFSILLLVERAPPLYHAYLAVTVFLWTQIFNDFQFIKAAWSTLISSESKCLLKLCGTCAVSILILEFLVASFSERRLYTLFFLTAGPCGAFYIMKSFRAYIGAPIFIWASCWILSLFTMFPADIPENTTLVITSGAIVVFIALVSRWFNSSVVAQKYCSSICTERKQSNGSKNLFIAQAFLVLLSSLMVSLSTSHRTQNRELLALHQVINWVLAGLGMVLPLFSVNTLLSRLSSVFLGFAPAFLLLSIGYEAVFYGALGLVLMSWILVESAILSLSSKAAPTHNDNIELKLNLYRRDDERCLQLSDMRVPLCFLVLFNVAFFGTGNFASIASFEISSVYRFITIFSPFLMAGLLVFKLFIPFMLVICVFSAITKLMRLPRLGCYFLVIVFSDVMTIHFFFLVRNTGSWMEIGNSISHFGIMSAQVVFVLLLFALTNVYTKNIEISSPHYSSHKVL